MRTNNSWLNEYGESHKNKKNKFIHWVCVPAIVFSILGLFYSVKIPFYVLCYQINLGVMVSAVAFVYYFSLSPALSVGMFFYLLVCMLFANLIESRGFIPLWPFSIIVFVLAWVGQYYGHKLEGKKPSFLKDIQFLMIGPAWLMSFVYKKLGIGL